MRNEERVTHNPQPTTNTRFARERRALHARLAQWVAETGDAFVLPDV